MSPRFCGWPGKMVSGRLLVLMDEAPEQIGPHDPRVRGRRYRCRAQWWRKVQGAMRPDGVVVLDVDAQDPLQVAGAGDEEPVEALGADGADPALGVRVRPRRPGRGLQDADAGVGEHGVERGGELGVSVPDQVAELVGVVAEVEQEVAGGLGRPRLGRMRSDAQDVHAAAVDLEHEEHVQAGEGDGLDGEEVTRQGARGLGAQERDPARATVPSRSGAQPVRCPVSTPNGRRRCSRGSSPPHRLPAAARLSPRHRDCSPNWSNGTASAARLARRLQSREGFRLPNPTEQPRPLSVWT